MRAALIVVLLALGACAPQPAPVAAPVPRPVISDADAARNLAQQQADAAALGPPSAAAIRDRQAEAICRARGQTAEATYPGSPRAGILYEALTAVTMRNQVASTCIETYRATGIMPSY